MKASIFLTATLLTFCLTSNAQKKRIYYFADTVTKKGIKPLLEIGTEASVLTYYHFFIKVYPDVERELSFTYRNDRSKSKAITGKPRYNYLSFEKLVETIRRTGEDFNLKYDLYFIQKLPDKKYITNQVVMVPNRTYVIN